jgi:TatA/E family protein of Tat protein translocase
MGEGLFQPTHLIIILVIVLIIFGAGKLPEIGGAMGMSIKEFKQNASDSPDALPGSGATPAAGMSTTATAARGPDLPGIRADEL